MTNLFSEFKAVTKKEWNSNIISNLNGVDIENNLISTSENIKRLTKNQYTGTLNKGELADFIAIDINNERMQPLFDVVNNLVMSATSSQVRYVFINGEEIIGNFNFSKIDSEKILNEGIEIIDKLFNKSGFKQKIEDGEFL